ncbi:hypothetical protein KIPB_003631 [Kipferlia bialata]|uniref:Uncharacterized protein n=1 Tax=Kipferlia bialata TaxID=797122 RepID=A0A9K3GH67_9EUKA|nr:hypothetical protein KIPB_003631 [Kipferlia bialata]|eukprot:g3631.t1
MDALHTDVEAMEVYLQGVKLSESAGILATFIARWFLDPFRHKIRRDICDNAVCGVLHCTPADIRRAEILSETGKALTAPWEGVVREERVERESHVSESPEEVSASQKSVSEESEDSSSEAVVDEGSTSEDEAPSTVGLPHKHSMGQSRKAIEAAVSQFKKYFNNGPVNNIKYAKRRAFISEWFIDPRTCQYIWPRSEIYALFDLETASGSTMLSDLLRKYRASQENEASGDSYDSGRKEHKESRDEADSLDIVIDPLPSDRREAAREGYRAMLAHLAKLPPRGTRAANVKKAFITAHLIDHSDGKLYGHVLPIMKLLKCGKLTVHNAQDQLEINSAGTYDSGSAGTAAGGAGGGTLEALAEQKRAVLESYTGDVERLVAAHEKLEAKVATLGSDGAKGVQATALKRLFIRKWLYDPREDGVVFPNAKICLLLHCSEKTVQKALAICRDKELYLKDKATSKGRHGR